jgi:site-specific recombinase XerC
MDDIRQTAIDRFRAYLERRQFSAHTVANYTLALRLFFAEVAVPLAQLSYREVDQFVEQQHQQGHAWATINRRLYALKHFCDFCLTQQLMGGNPVKPLCPARTPPPQSALTGAGPAALCADRPSDGSCPVSRDAALWTAGLRGGRPQTGAD